MPQRILYLVRHGHYASTTTPPSEPDGPLTAIGQEQATLTAQRIRPFPISNIHHSTLQRARETATIIAAQFPTVPLYSSPLLCECIPCIPSAFGAFFEGIPAEVIAAGGPQAQQVFDTYFKPADASDQYEVIISSGNLISYLICRILGAPPDAWIHTDIQHCGISEIVIGSPRRVLLVRHNDTGHLPAHLQTFS
jgi:serine/threonine-protein phosphatase PGAM5